MELCRLCHLETVSGNCRNVFLREDNDLKLMEIIIKLTEISILENDPFPKIICNNCYITLINFYNFRQMVVQANLRFHQESIKQEENNCNRDIVEIVDIKQEIVEPEIDADNCHSEDDCDETFLVLADDARPFKCRTCNKQFAHKFSLMGHLRIHTHEKPFRCYMCYKRYPFKQLLQQHLLIHKNAKIFSCDVCPKQFYRKSYLNQHLKLHNIDNPFKCNYCSRVCLSAIYLKKHLRIHTKEKPFDCPVCGKRFAEKCNLTKHLVVHDGTKQFQCDMCKKFFTTKHTLRVHSMRHICTARKPIEKPFVCGVCQRDFALKGSLTRHYKQKH